MAPSVQRRKVWLTPTTTLPCSKAAKTRNPLKFARCPKLANRSQSLVSQSSPYYEDTWRRYCCLWSPYVIGQTIINSFIPIVDKCLSCEYAARQSCAMVPKWRFFASCIFQRAACSRLSDLHSKFALRPHHAWKYGRHLISDR